MTRKIALPSIKANYEFYSMVYMPRSGSLARVHFLDRANSGRSLEFDLSFFSMELQNKAKEDVVQKNNPWMKEIINRTMKVEKFIIYEDGLTYYEINVYGDNIVGNLLIKGNLNLTKEEFSDILKDIENKIN